MSFEEHQEHALRNGNRFIPTICQIMDYYNGYFIAEESIFCFAHMPESI